MIKVNFKSYILILWGALLCLTTSCSGKNSSDKEKGEVSTMLEAIELGADPQKIKEAKDAAETTENVGDDETIPSTGRGEWDGNALTYNDETRHLFWDISAFQNWEIVDEDRLPKDMQFAAVNEDYSIVVAVVAMPIQDKKVTSVWELPKENVINRSLAVQVKAFPGSENKEPVCEKVQFRDKSAYQITFNSDVPDSRNGETVVIPYQIRLVAVVSDHEIIELMVMVPQEILDKYGDDVYSQFFGKFNIVPA